MKKILSAIILIISIIPVFILPLFGNIFNNYWMLTVITILLLILSIRINKDIFPTILFFTLIHITRPLNYYFTDLINMNFPGTFFLIPIILFTLLILTIPSIRINISWWRKDTIDKKSILIITGLSLLSGITLFVWGRFVTNDLSKFTDNLPNVPIEWIIINGIGFAILNAIAEEYLSRGMLCNGLEKLKLSKCCVITIQAIIFSVFHYYGFPGGSIGMIMVFTWSIVLGLLRYHTLGLIGVLIGHFFADLTIYFTLYVLQ